MRISKLVPILLLLVAGGSCSEVDRRTLNAPIRELEITAWQWGYQPGAATAREGQLVRVTVSSLDVDHSLTNNELGLNEIIPSREKAPRVFEFRAPKRGVYSFTSETPSGPGRGLMRFKLNVVP